MGKLCSRHFENIPMVSLTSCSPSGTKNSVSCYPELFGVGSLGIMFAIRAEGA